MSGLNNNTLITNELNRERFEQIIFDGIPTNYLISTYGLVYSTKYYGGNRVMPLVDRISSNGYHNITLLINNKKHTFTIHRLVAEYFIPNPDNLPIVNHIDGDKNNNHVENLEWVSSKDNSIHAANNSLLPIGEKSRLCKINNEIAYKICMDILNNIPFMDIANKYNTTYNTVYDIYRHKSWKQLTANMDFSKYTADKRYSDNVKI